MRALIVPEKGIPGVDDTVLGKLHSQKGKIELGGGFWSGRHRKAIQGINW